MGKGDPQKVGNIHQKRLEQGPVIAYAKAFK